MPPLSPGQFAQQQLEIQGLTVKEFARRSGLGLSHAYQILGGKRPNLSADTLEAVAKGLGMTAAEMLVGMGKGAPEADPRRAMIHALLRQVPDEDLSTVERVVRPFIAPVTEGPTTGHRDGPTNRRSRNHRELAYHTSILRPADLYGGISTVRRRLKAVVQSTLANLERLVTPPTGGLSVEPAG